jgi:Bacteriophage baseplate protein W
MSRQPFLGRGWSIPLRPDPVGRLGLAEGGDKVRQSIYLILDTEPGERIMRPAFGCGLRRYLMAPNTTATRALIQRDVELALTAWEPRIQLRSVAVSPGDDPALTLIEIFYIHVRDGREGNFVYPFYLD